MANWRCKNAEGQELRYFLGVAWVPDLFSEPVDLMGVRIHPGYLDRVAQDSLVHDLRGVASHAPFQRYETPGGRKLSVRMTAAGARGWMTDRKSYIEPIQLGDVMRGLTVAEVVESKAEGFAAGDLVSGNGPH